jgi:hypothetical protein
MTSALIRVATLVASVLDASHPDRPNPGAGTFGVNLNVVAIRAVVVNTSAMSGEHGQAAADMVNVVTKSHVRPVRFRGRSFHLENNNVRVLENDARSIIASVRNCYPCLRNGPGEFGSSARLRASRYGGQAGLDPA